METIMFGGKEFILVDYSKDKRGRKEPKLNEMKKEPCEIYGKTKTIRHHETYDDNPKFRWLCRSCHLKLHSLMRRYERNGVRRSLNDYK